MGGDAGPPAGTPPYRDPAHPLGYRRRASDRACFEGIVWRLVTGCSWADAGRLAGVSATTLQRRADAPPWPATASPTLSSPTNAVPASLPTHATPAWGLGLRWPVERTNSWLSNFGQLRRNTDRRPHPRHAQLSLAITLIITPARLGPPLEPAPAWLTGTPLPPSAYPALAGGTPPPAPTRPAPRQPTLAMSNTIATAHLLQGRLRNAAVKAPASSAQPRHLLDLLD